MSNEFVFVVNCAFSDTDIDPAFTQIVEQCELHCETDRMVERHLQHREANPDPRRAHRQRRCEEQRIVIDAFSGEIVLRQPHIVEPQRLRSTNLFDLLIDTYGVLIGRR